MLGNTESTGENAPDVNNPLIALQSAGFLHNSKGSLINKPGKATKQGANVLSVPECVGSSNKKASEPNASNTTQVPVLKPVSIADMSSLDLTGLSRDEKIKKLRDSIASLEEENQKQEMDRELQQLMDKHDELTRKLSQSSSSNSKKQSGGVR